MTLTILDLDRLRAAPLHLDPFEFVLVESFLGPEHLPALVADFPEIRGHGSFPVNSLKYGPAFARLIAALSGAALRRAIEEKFDIDLSGHPIMVTVRGKSDGKDGRIHTDSESKIITLLLYLNPVWDLAEVPPTSKIMCERWRRSPERCLLFAAANDPSMGTGRMSASAACCS